MGLGGKAARENDEGGGPDVDSRVGDGDGIGESEVGDIDGTEEGDNGWRREELS